MKQLVGFGKLFHGWVRERTTENAQKIYYISHIFANYPSLNWKFSILNCLDNVWLPKEILQGSQTTDLKFEKLLSFLLSVLDATSPLQSMLQKSLLVSFHLLYFRLNPMDKLFTAWKSYFIVIFTDKSWEVTSKWFWCMRTFNV